MINKKVLILREEYGKLEEQVSKLEEKRDKVLRRLQRQCSHPAVAETPTSYCLGSVSNPPMRICEVCGYEEGGWTYKKLTDKKVTREVNGDEFYNFRYPTKAVFIIK